MHGKKQCAAGVTNTGEEQSLVSQTIDAKSLTMDFVSKNHTIEILIINETSLECNILLCVSNSEPILIKKRTLPTVGTWKWKSNDLNCQDLPI